MLIDFQHCYPYGGAEDKNRAVALILFTYSATSGANDPTRSVPGPKHRARRREGFL
jgi:hypothetical protein